ncbi:MAG: S41 family peptidase [Eubacteriales bacterium]|nr:S41 family peptidase [Eubacteriales bacterium]
MLSVSLLFVLGNRKKTDALDSAALQELADTIDSQYYFYKDKELDNDKLLDAAMRGMVSKLEDPYAQYFTEDEYKKLLSDNAGDYVGIGISIQVPDETGAKVISVYGGSPADKAGIQKGDVITNVNGNATAEKSLEEAITFFSKDATVSDEITYLRNGVETTVSVLRAEIHIVRVTSSVLDGNIGYVHISEFNGSVATDFTSAVDALQEQGINKLIIDLRDNPGGGLTEVLNVAYRLIPKGKRIVSIRSKNGDEDVYNSMGTEQYSMPIVVLVNGNSASASELLTGALKDYGIATIVGTQTFGKGIVQSFFHLSNGKGWVKMTTDAYYTPNGVCIQGVGITPDIVVNLPDELKDTSIDLLDPAKDTQLQAAINAFAQQAKAQQTTNQ